MWSLFPKTKTPLIALMALIGVISVISEVVGEERKNEVGISVDFMGGATNQVGQTTTLQGLDFNEFYSVYPGIELRSVGEHSKLDLNYSFAAERYEMSPAFTTTSHAFTGSFDAQLGAKTHFRLYDTLNTAPDYSTINVLKGLAFTPEGFQFVFEPQLYKRSNISNSASTALDVDLTPKSFLTFEASGSYRHYEDVAAGSYLSDQTRIGGSLEFSHKASKRLTWNLKYSVWQNDYQNYANTRSHSATVGFSGVLTPSVTLNLEAGPAYTEKSDVAGYVVNLSLAKQMRTNRFSAGYSRLTGDSTGLGGTSDSHQGRLSFSQSLGRKISINFDAVGFKQGLPYDYWGVQGSAAFSWQLARYWVATMGSSYMRNDAYNTYNNSNNYNNYNSKRVYMSFGYRKNIKGSANHTK